MFFQEKLDGELLEDIGIKLKSLRKVQKMTQLEVAKRIGVSRKHLSEMETGNANSLITFIKLLRLYEKYNQLNVLLETSLISPKEKFRESQK